MGRNSWGQCKFRHQCGTWSKNRQFVALRQEQAPEPTCQPTLFEIKKYDYFCYVVSKLDDCPWATHKRYGKRATSETWREEAKNQMALNAIKTNSFDANSVLFQCAILAYKLNAGWRFAAAINSFVAGSPQRFGLLIRVGGLFRTDSRQWKLQVPETMLYQAQWDAWLEVAAS